MLFSVTEPLFHFKKNLLNFRLAFTTKHLKLAA